MYRAVVLLPEAVADVADAYGWYERQAAGLGDEFLNCLEAAYAKIAEHPMQYPIRFDSFRRILVRRFPYAVYFEHDEKFPSPIFHVSSSMSEEVVIRVENLGNAYRSKGPAQSAPTLALCPLPLVQIIDFYAFYAFFCG